MTTQSTSGRARGRKLNVPTRNRASRPRAPFPGAAYTVRAPQLTAISAAVLVTLGASRHALALPTGEQVTAGSVSIQRPSASSMIINQVAPKAAINWQGFSIGKQETVAVQQPSSSSMLLNRVIGADASDIQGRLTSNGQVFLLNPNGIVFGPTAQVNVGGLVVSTLSLSDRDFVAGNYQF
jgi:filamentous hemagglutinin family protein